jgi:hypothetical protein
MIRGRVTDAVSGLTLAGVKIKTVGINSFVAYSMSDGQYMIAVYPNTERLKFSLKGYEIKDVEIEGAFTDAALYKKGIPHPKRDKQAVKKMPVNDSITVESKKKIFKPVN